MRATHLGDFFGIPATGKRVEVSGMHILRIANGKIGGEDVLLPTCQSHGKEFHRAGVKDKEGILLQRDPFGFGEPVNN